VRRDDIVAALRAHEAELRAAGVASLSLFGSTARGDEQETSDVDVLVRLEPDPARDGFAYFGFMEQLAHRLEAIVHRRRRDRGAGAQTRFASRSRKGSRRCLLTGRSLGFATSCKTSNELSATPKVTASIVSSAMAGAKMRSSAAWRGFPKPQ
jgi:uncharacterized protein